MTAKLKDPDAVKDYVVDFADEMVKTSDTITAIVGVTASPSGLNVGAGTPPAPSIVAGHDKSGNTVASSAVRFWLSSGTVDTTYGVLVRVTTAGARTLDYTATFRITQA